MELEAQCPDKDALACLLITQPNSAESHLQKTHRKRYVWMDGQICQSHFFSQYIPIRKTFMRLFFYFYFMQSHVTFWSAVTCLNKAVFATQNHRFLIPRFNDDRGTHWCGGVLTAHRLWELELSLRLSFGLFPLHHLQFAFFSLSETPISPFYLCVISLSELGFHLWVESAEALETDSGSCLVHKISSNSPPPPTSSYLIQNTTVFCQPHIQASSTDLHTRMLSGPPISTITFIPFHKSELKRKPFGS